MRGTGIGRQCIGIHRKTVVLTRDVDTLRFNVFHRVIGAVMAELHLEGLRTDGEPHDLMTEADAEKRQLGRDGLVRHLNGVCARRRIAGTVRKEDAVGLMLHRFFKGRLSRHDRHTDAAIRKEAQDIGLDAEVIGNDVIRENRCAAEPGRLALARRLPAAVRPVIDMIGRNGLCQILAGH